jgi:dihydrofolate synthase/folylpolyglutamate synthase
MAVLGNTLEEIAGEKAGIMKPGCPVVMHDQQPSVLAVLQENFREINQGRGAVDTPQLYVASKEDYEYVRTIPMKMSTGYQIENAATALLAARVIFGKWEEEGLLVATKEAQEAWIRIGIAEAFWKGRMEIINEHPFFMIDGAHNSHGVNALANSLKELYPGEKFHFIMGVMADKDYEEMIDVLLPLAIDFVTVTPESNRALQSKDLAECIQKKGVQARYVENMEDAIRPLLPCTKGDTTILNQNTGETRIRLAGGWHKTVAFGSLYFIGAIEAMLEENGK